jgi:hypothetical protein
VYTALFPIASEWKAKQHTDYPNIIRWLDFVQVKREMVFRRLSILMSSSQHQPDVAFPKTIAVQRPSPTFLVGSSSASASSSSSAAPSQPANAQV